jgi:hypothetical protein
VRITLEVQALFCRRRHQPRRPPGSALKGSVNLCQRQLVNEVLGLALRSSLARDLGRKVATPIQRGFNAESINAVQKMQGVVQKMQVEQSFSFVLLLKQETHVRRKESSDEKVRSMPWKAGIRCPLP